MSLTFFEIGTASEEICRYVKWFLRPEAEGSEAAKVMREIWTKDDNTTTKKIPVDVLLEYCSGRMDVKKFIEKTGFRDDKHATSKSALLRAVSIANAAWLRESNSKIIIAAEKHWLKSKKPYFKVYPDYANMFRKTKLEVPFDSFVFPYQVFDVLFSNEQPLQTERSNIYGFRIIVSDKGDPKFDVLEAKYPKPYIKQVTIFPYYRMRGYEHVSISCGCLNMYVEDKPGLVVEEMFANNMEFFTHSFEMVVEGMKSHPVYKHLTREEISRDLPELAEVIQVCLRISLSISFLHGGYDTDLLGPDFLKKDLQPYIDALNKTKPSEEKAKQAIVERIRKKADDEREAKGVAIGKHEYLLGRRYIVHTESDPEGEGSGGRQGRELHYCHVREPHFRMVRYGTGRTQVRSRFIRQIIVRKDLPPKPSDGAEMGFSTPK